MGRPKASYWACFLSVASSYRTLYFGRPAHFENATRAHTSFNRRPTNLTEHATRIFYYMAALPIVGLFISFLQIMIWWICEMVLASFTKSYTSAWSPAWKCANGFDCFEETSKFRQLPASSKMLPMTTNSSLKASRSPCCSCTPKRDVLVFYATGRGDLLRRRAQHCHEHPHYCPGCTLRGHVGL